MDYKDQLAWVNERMAKQNLPPPAKPKLKDPEFTIPTDPSKLTNHELGSRMLQTSAWYAYAQYLLGRCESELVLVEAEFRLKANVVMQELRKEVGRINQEAIESIAVANNPEELGGLYERRVQLMSIRKQLESRILIYEKGYNAFSREQSRREMEARVSGG